SRLVLVDEAGHIRAYADGAGTEQLPLFRGEILELIWYNRLPGINAILNGTSAFLLAVGYLAIRRRLVTFHKTCMLLALVVSALFLASYLFYHFVVRGGQPTRFQGPEVVRILYLAILLSHTVLAVLVAPLALFTAYLGLMNRIRRHMKIARWTLP